MKIFLPQGRVRLNYMIHPKRKERRWYKYDYIFHIFVCVCIYILQMKCAEEVKQLKRDSTLCQNIDMEQLLNLLIYYCFPKQE